MKQSNIVYTPLNFFRRLACPVFTAGLSAQAKHSKASSIKMSLVQIPRSKQEQRLVKNAVACPNPQGRRWNAEGPGGHQLSGAAEWKAGRWGLCTEVAFCARPLTFPLSWSLCNRQILRGVWISGAEIRL